MKKGFKTAKRGWNLGFILNHPNFGPFQRLHREKNQITNLQRSCTRGSLIQKLQNWDKGMKPRFQVWNRDFIQKRGISRLKSLTYRKIASGIILGRSILDLYVSKFQTWVLVMKPRFHLWNRSFIYREPNLNQTRVRKAYSSRENQRATGKPTKKSDLLLGNET